MEDEALLDLLRRPASRERGFRLLVDRYGARLYTHIRRLVVEHEDANDVLQNVLVKVYRNVESFRAESRLYTWLYRIATNEAISWLEKHRRRRTLSLEDEAQWVGEQLVADTHFDGDEAQRQLQQAIALLPPKQRVVFNLRYFDEMSYGEMADMLGTSEGALKASYHHAVKKIESYLKNQSRT